MSGKKQIMATQTENKRTKSGRTKRTKSAQDKRTKSAQERRDQITDATIDTIVEVGLEQTTIARVAKRAGLSQGSIISYVKNKPAMIEEALRHLCIEYKKLWRGANELEYDNPVLHLFEILMVDVSKSFCTPRNVSLWHILCSGGSMVPRFENVEEIRSLERLNTIEALAKKEEQQLIVQGLDAKSFTHIADALTDGFTIQLHILRNTVTREELQLRLSQFVAICFPSHRKQIMDRLSEIQANEKADIPPNTIAISPEDSPIEDGLIQADIKIQPAESNEDEVQQLKEVIVAQARLIHELTKDSQ